MRTLCLMSVLGAWALAQPLSGSYTIVGSSADFTSNQFPTIQAAFDSLTNRGASGVVTITLPPGTGWTPASEPQTITLRGYTCTNCQVTLILDTTEVLSKAPSATTGNRFVLRFEGNIQNFTLDGKGKFTIQTTTSGGTTTANLGLVSTTSKPLVVNNFTVRDLVIQGNGRSNTFAGIYLGPDASLTSGGLNAGSSIDSIQIIGTYIDFVSRPIHLRGARSILQNIIITDNRIGLANTQSWAAIFNIGGVHIIGGQNIQVLRNTITGAESGPITSANNVAGIRLDSCENFEIARNWIYGMRYTGNQGRGEHGIFVRLPATFLNPNSTHRIHNNMIADILGDARGTAGPIPFSPDGGEFVSGIYLGAFAALTDARTEIYHNSIHLFGDNSSVNSAQSGGESAAITVGDSIRGGLLIEGNILQNTLRIAQQPKPAYGVRFLGSTIPANTTINYNAYYVQVAAIPSHTAGVGGTNYTTFADWQGASFAPEANGVGLTSPANFTSNTDLHLVASVPSPLINAGKPSYNGTQDFDGQTRPLPTGPSAYTDPGALPDLGADELDGSVPGCLSTLFAPNVITTTTPALGSGEYFWGTTIQIDTAAGQNPASGTLQLIYSTDNGATWTAGPSVSSLPISFTLPNLTPPAYTGTIHIALMAQQSANNCFPNTPDTSDVLLSLNLTDRPGNRQANAIPLTLTFNSTTNVWEAAVQDSINGPATTNEYGSGTGVPTNPRGTASRDIFFKLTLPACLDSLRLNTCDAFTNFGTRINLINLTEPDTTADEDQGSNFCSSAGFANPQFTAHLIALGAVGSSPIKPFNEDPNIPDRDTIRLRANDELLIIVEGYNAGASGRFALAITGYPTASQTLFYQGTPRSSGSTISLSTTGSSIQDTFTATGGFQREWRVFLPNQTTPTTIVSGDTLIYTFTQAGTYMLVAHQLHCDEKDTLYVNVSFITGLRTTDQALSVYPNPSSGSFTILNPAGGNLTIRIVDLTGRIAFEQTAAGDRIPVSVALPAGLYQMVISGNSGATIPIVIQP